MIHNNYLNIIVALWVVMQVGLAALVALKIIMSVSQYLKVRKLFVQHDVYYKVMQDTQKAFMVCVW